MKRHIALGAVLALAAGILTSSVAGNHTADSVKPEVSLDTAAKSADAYIEPHAKEIHADADKEKFQRVDAQRSHGLTYVSYEREYRGLPVVGGDFVVVTDNSGEVKYSQAAQSKRISVGIDPKVSKSAATKKAEKATKGDAQGDPRLVVLAWGDPALAWETVVDAKTSEGMPTETYVYTDAVSGKVLEKSEVTRAGTGNTHYNGTPGTVTFGTTSSGGSYVMRDPARNGLSCARQGGQPYTDADDTWGNGTGSDLVTACVDAMYAAGQQGDMLSTWLGRNGINGNGGYYPLYVGLQQQNAFWNGSSATFGYAPGGQLVPLDVVAHELGHGIFQTTPGGSSGNNETGGLNEGTGDIFGALTEWWDNQPTTSGYDAPDYLVGERADFLIRDMANPGSQGDPNCWSTSIPNTEVHAAAGPINHWFYLLAEGTAAGGPGKPGSTTCNGTTLSGIGIQKAGQVFMGALNGKTSGWTYTQARRAALNFAATSTLFPTCAEYNAAKAAFNAVSVPASSDPTCSKGTNDFSVSVSPTSGKIDQGGSTTATVNTATTSGSAQQVALSATANNSTVTASVSPSTVTSGNSATLTVSAAANTPDGTYTVTVKGTATSGSKEATYSIQVGDVTGPVEVFTDDFTGDKGWTTNAGGGDTATLGVWSRGDPAATTYSGTTLQRNDCASETTCLVTDPRAGTGPGDYDVDGGITSVTSPQFALPSGKSASLKFQGYLAHLNNSSSADYLRISVQTSSGTTTVHTVSGAASNRSGTWTGYTVDLSAYAGQSVRLVVSAADASTGSLVEAAVDNVVVTSG
ncbi:M4 family metallopeptidase [Stackebrandtia nassauensis]|uniref:Peptidase M4 thermolysin n=1 Tax=Stackebrandtia nassauensis (strain DSM 44728 / CIP 108903 / NRRL B-16338 / NBRC 102104 / LLR-40K-21) TaxID=446470 RepID=D3Q7T1_STANL|nr:M4 family metallopeptidase [Stackebrandtia nassauensis]ADD44423.1 peptidase M4 thermolysin [Stackebrandtia nassauensis DSM 44728]